MPTKEHDNKKKMRTMVLALTTSICLIAGLSQSNWFNQLEWQLLDQLAKIRAESQKASDKILIIDIDDYSLNSLSKFYGKWPWPRSLHAEVVDYIAQATPSAIAFDILFSEKDTFRPDSDAFFNEVIARHSNIYFAAASQTTLSANGTPLLASYPVSIGLVQTPDASIHARKLIITPNAIDEQSWKIGSIDFNPDKDGVGRQYRLWHDFEGWRLISLPLLIAQSLGYDSLNTDLVRIDWQGVASVPHQRISFAEVLANARGELQTLPSSIFETRIVLIGTTALGLHDTVSTPISSSYPGISVLSNVMDNLITNRYQKNVPRYYSLISVIAVLVVCFCVAIMRSRIAASNLALIASILLVVLFLVCPVIGAPLQLFAGICGTICFSLICFFDVYFEKKRQLGDTIELFGRFLDPKIVNELVEEGIGESLLDTRSVEITVLFSDIRNFTSISESRTPGEMVNLLNHYFEKQVDVLFRHQATLDKFIGDAVMAFWGAPLKHAEHPVRAIEAALDMMDQLAVFKEEYGFNDFDIGIGIHTGDAVVGMIGAKQRYDYTAIGDTVNLASRIEGLTKKCAHILVSESTMIVAKDYFHFEERGEFSVKGRSKPVRVFEPFRLGRD